MQQPKLKWFILITPVFIYLTHALSAFTHEYFHSFAAWYLGYKHDPLDINYGGTSWDNIFLLVNISENVNYQMIAALGKFKALAIIAFAGIGLGNGLVYLISVLLLFTKSIKKQPFTYYFLFWLNLMSIGNMFSYVPIRVFGLYADMGNIHQALLISPWVTYIVFGYIVAFLIWHFYTHTLIKSYVVLKLSQPTIQTGLLILTTLVLFGYFGTAGLIAYGVISRFLAMTSVAIIPAIILACWPKRGWVKERFQAYNG